MFSENTFVNKRGRDAGKGKGTKEEDSGKGSQCSVDARVVYDKLSISKVNEKGKNRSKRVPV